MKPRRILKNKKGIALENAILFMVIVFSFCALLTSLTLFGHYQTKLDKITLTNKETAEIHAKGNSRICGRHSFSLHGGGTCEYASLALMRVSLLGEKHTALLHLYARFVGIHLHFLCGRIIIPA